MPAQCSLYELCGSKQSKLYALFKQPGFMYVDSFGGTVFILFLIMHFGYPPSVKEGTKPSLSNQ